MAYRSLIDPERSCGYISESTIQRRQFSLLLIATFILQTDLRARRKDKHTDFRTCQTLTIRSPLNAKLINARSDVFDISFSTFSRQEVQSHSG